MTKKLSSGFDIAVQVSEDTIERIFQSYYWLGNFPNHVTKPFSQNGKDYTVEIFFHEPELELAAPTANGNPVKLTFGFTVRLTNHDWEDTGSASVMLSAIPLSLQDGDIKFTALGVDFGSLGGGDFVFTSASYPELTTVVKPLVLSSLLKAKSIILSPPSAISAELLTWKTYTDPNGDNFLAVFINTSPDNGAVLPPSVTSFLGPNDDARVAIPVEHVNEAIKSGLAGMGLDKLPRSIQFDGGAFTVNALEIELKNHYVEITGNVDDIDFVAKGNLGATDTGLHIDITWINVDMPWYIDIASALTGGALQRALEDALPSALEGVGVGAFLGFGIFSQTLPGIDVLLELHNSGYVSTSKDGIVISASVAAIFDPVDVALPTYLTGNKQSKEFHRDGCPYLAKLKWQNKVTFIREAAAIHAGYNGCYTCAREYSHPAGRVIFGYRSGGNAPNSNVDVDVTVEGKLMDPLVVDGVTVTDPPFSTKLRVKRHADANGVWQAMDFSSANLVIPGLWRFRAHTGNWTGECTMQVKPSAAKFGSTNLIAFTVGKPQGSSGYGKMPQFP